MHSPSASNLPSWAINFPEGSYIEVINRGIPQNCMEIPCNTKRFVIGRLPESDGVIDDILVSKSHLLFVYGKNNEETNTFWVMDLGSRNQSQINKKSMNPYEFYSLTFGDVIQIAANNVTLFLNKKSSPPKNVQKISNNLIPTFKATKPPKSDQTEKEQIHTNPVQLIKSYFERKGLEPDYEVEEQQTDHGKRYLTRLSLNIYDEDGEEITAEVTTTKRASGIEECAKVACRILDDCHELFEEEIETVEQIRKRKLAENDYYDDDDDIFYDRSGQIEQKRKSRLQRYGQQDETKIQTYDSLNERLNSIRKRKSEIKKKILESPVSEANQSKNNVDDDEDELDKFMKSFNETNEKEERESELIDLEFEEKEIVAVIAHLKPMDIFLKKDSNLNENKDETSPDVPKTEKIDHAKSYAQSNERNTKSISKDSKCPAPDKTVKHVPPLPPKKASIDRYTSTEDTDDIGWVPPDEQIGDGKTALNNKFNY